MPVRIFGAAWATATLAFAQRLTKELEVIATLRDRRAARLWA